MLVGWIYGRINGWMYAGYIDDYNCKVIFRKMNDTSTAFLQF